MSETLTPVPAGPFSYAAVDFKVHNVTTVSWELKRDFRAPTPYRYQLQWGRSGNPDAGAWTDIGSLTPNVSTLQDSTRRQFGNAQVVHYRVKLVDAADQVHFSEPINTEGILSWREWLLARELIFRTKLIYKKQSGTDGYLMKAKRSGPSCTRCINQYSGGAQDSKCPVCYGTGFLGGYYAAIPAHFITLSAGDVLEDVQEPRGPVGDEFSTGIFIASPTLSTLDFWVEGDSDTRYYLQKITTLSQIRGVPLAYSVDLRRAGSDSVIYTVPLEGTP